LAVDGMVNVKSGYDVKQTSDRLERALLSKGIRVFARINHAAGAQSVGLALRPTELIIFGNPKVGSPLMQCRQSVALDLPQKALIWQAADDQVWLSYNAPEYLASRHQLDACAEQALQKVSAALANFSRVATSP
jgi:uncharacterized protein (DUF302 family)